MRICVGDLEANGLLDSVTKVWCGVFKDIHTKEIFRFTPETVGNEMLKFLGTCDVLILHNGIGYDAQVMEKLLHFKYQGKIVDTLIMSRLQNPKRMLPFGYKGKGGPHSIEAWGFRLGHYKLQHDEWEAYSEAMLQRCEQDVLILEKVYEALLSEANGFSWGAAWKTSFKLFEILEKQEAYGWLVDRPHLEKSIRMLEHWIHRIDTKLTPRLPKVREILETKTKGVLNYVRSPFLASGNHNPRVRDYYGDAYGSVVGPFSRVAFRPVDLNSNAEVKDYLLSVGWIPLSWNTNDAGERTSPKLDKEDPFEGIQGSVGRLIAKRVKCRHRKSVLEGWLTEINEDGRLPSVVTGLAVTGRATHSVIVNVPNVDSFFGKWMRKVFICPEGRVLIGTDAASCQDRMLAQRAKDQDFTNMLLFGDKSKGTDGHSLAMKAVNRALDEHHLPHIGRGKAKNFNFGWKFGASDNKLGSMVGGSKAVGGDIRKELEQVFPAQAKLVEELTKEWRSNAKKLKGKWGGVEYKNGWIRGLDGRPIHIESEHAILVYMLQSDEAVCMANAYVLLYETLLSKGYVWGHDWAYVCWYHDEYTIECEEELAYEISKLAEWAIGEAGRRLLLNHCEQVGCASIGKSWYEIH